MRKRLARWLSCCWAAALFLPLSAQAAPYAAPIGQAEPPAKMERMFDSVLLADAMTNTVLFEKEAEKAFTPTGGAVSLMTAYIVMQEANWEQEIPIIDGVEALSSKVRRLNLRAGERWLVKDLTAGMLLHGAQDASLVLCDHISGSQEAFTALMNQYAAALGMEHTTYQNPLGAYAAGQTTTVSDLLILARAVLENDTLRELLGKSVYDTVNGITIKNRMEIMQENRISYDERIQGLAAGSTSHAGTNMLLYAVESEKALLLIAYSEVDDQALGEQNAKLVLDYFWEAYQPVEVTQVVQTLLQEATITASDGTQIVLGIRDAACTVLAERETAKQIMQNGSLGFTMRQLPAVTAAPAVGDEIGSVSLCYQGQDVLEVALTAAQVIPPESEEPSSGKDTQQQIEIPVYTATDWMGGSRQRSFTDRYGFWIIVTGAALVSAALLIAVKRPRRKKR